MHAFDPFNMSLTLSSHNTVSLIFVDAASEMSVDCLPNLLRLKRDVRIMFRQFASCDNVVQREVTCLFPRAGVVVLHDDVLRRCSAGMWIFVRFDFVHSSAYTSVCTRKCLHLCVGLNYENRLWAL